MSAPHATRHGTDTVVDMTFVIANDSILSYHARDVEVS